MRSIDAAKASKETAKAAASKPAAFGEDIDLDKYAHSGDELPIRMTRQSCRLRLRNKWHRLVLH